MPKNNLGDIPVEDMIECRMQLTSTVEDEDIEVRQGYLPLRDRLNEIIRFAYHEHRAFVSEEDRPMVIMRDLKFQRGR